MNSLSAQLTLTVVRLSSLIVQFSGGGGCASFSPVTIPGTPSSASFLYSYLHARVWFLREVYFDFMKKVRISPVRGWRKGCLIKFFLREGEGGRLSGKSSKREIGLSFFRGCCVAKGFFSFFLSFFRVSFEGRRRLRSPAFLSFPYSVCVALMMSSTLANVFSFFLCRAILSS